MPEEERKINQQLSTQRIKPRGGLSFPLDYADISALKESAYILGQIQLSNGTATVFDPRITANNIGFATHSIFSGTIGVLSIQCQNNQAIITSTSNSDQSLVNYVIFF